MRPEQETARGCARRECYSLSPPYCRESLWAPAAKNEDRSWTIEDCQNPWPAFRSPILDLPFSFLQRLRIRRQISRSHSAFPERAKAECRPVDRPSTREDLDARPPLPAGDCG